MAVSITKLTAGEASDIAGITDVDPSAAVLAGMLVTVEFIDSLSGETVFTETLTWEATGGTSGGVTSSAYGWSLSGTGDTFSMLWEFLIPSALVIAGYALKRLVLDGRTAGVIFDTALPADPGSVGSDNGRDFAIATQVQANAINGEAVYDFPVSINGNPVVGDTFRRLSVTFESFGEVYQSFAFFQDTDKVATPVEPPSPPSGTSGSGIAFPSTLPPPKPQYELRFVGGKSDFESETGFTRRRRKTTSEVRVYTLRWTFTPTQYEIFRTWFEDTLGNGVRAFDIRLLDDDATLVWWTVASLGAAYEADADAAINWDVSMTVHTALPSFTTRVPGAADMSAFAEVSFVSATRLEAPGVRLLARGGIAFSGTAQLFTTMRANAALEFTGLAKLPITLETLAILEFESAARLSNPYENVLSGDGESDYLESDAGDLLEI